MKYRWWDETILHPARTYLVESSQSCIKFIYTAQNQYLAFTTLTKPWPRETKHEQRPFTVSRLFRWVSNELRRTQCTAWRCMRCRHALLSNHVLAYVIRNSGQARYLPRFDRRSIAAGIVKNLLPIKRNPDFRLSENVRAYVDYCESTSTS